MMTSCLCQVYTLHDVCLIQSFISQEKKNVYWSPFCSRYCARNHLSSHSVTYGHPWLSHFSSPLLMASGIRSDRQSAWRTMDRGSWHCTGSRDQDYPQGKEMQKGKIVVWGGLINSCEKKGSEKQRRKGKIYPFKCRVLKNSKER